MSADETPAPPKRFEVTVADGAAGAAVGYADERIELVLDRAYPPGRPIGFTLALAQRALALQGKAQGSKRRPDGTFEVRIKLTSLRREEREALARAFG